MAGTCSFGANLDSYLPLGIMDISKRTLLR